MPEILSIFSMIICFGFSGFYAVYAYNKRKDRKTAGNYILNGGFVLLLMMLGIACRFYFPFNRLGFLVTMIFITFAWSGVILAKCFTSEKSRKIVQYTLAGLLVLFTIAKLYFLTRWPLIGRLPFNLCHICVIFIVIQIFYKNKFLDNYILCFGVLGAILNYTSGSLFDNIGMDSMGWGFFNMQIFESIMLHDLLLMFCVFMFITKKMNIKRNLSLKNLIWLVPLFVFFIFFNQIFKTDYFFTGFYADTPGFMKSIYYAMPFRFSAEIGGISFEFNILHTVVVISLTGLVLFVFSFFAEEIQKRLHD